MGAVVRRFLNWCVHEALWRWNRGVFRPMVISSQESSVPAPLLEAEHLSRRHPGGRGWLLDDVSLAIRAGDRVAICGPSGSGKTLLLRALAALDHTDRGTLWWRGMPVAGKRVPQFRRHVIHLRQRPALFGSTVEESLRQPLRLAVHRGRLFARERILRWLQQLGRGESFLQQPTSELSGGEMQLVALLRALQLDPEVLLLDEPTAALDPATTLLVERLLHRWLSAEGQERAWVWVTHAPEQAGRVSDRQYAMHSGRLQEVPNR